MGQDCGQNDDRKAADGAARRNSMTMDRAVEADEAAAECDAPGHRERNRAMASRALSWEREARGGTLAPRRDPCGGHRLQIQASLSANCPGLAAMRSQSSVRASIPANAAAISSDP